MDEKRYANDPMLFIHQPNVKAPKAPMQDSYVTPKKSKKKESVEQSTESPDVSEQEIPKKRYAAKRPITEESVMEEDKEEEGQEESINKRKQFKDMTTRERIEYFLNTSEYAPKPKCEVKTEKRPHRGLILDFKDDIVKMQVGRKIVQIPFEEIKLVRMLGF